MKGNKKGFTLIEILVVVIIIGVLSAIAIPGYLRSMEKTKAASAMQALADIAKAEHDYFAVQSRYADDFGDLSISMKDESVQQDADGESYSTKHFTIELDDNLEAAKATRSGGDAPYTLYRLFDDPRIYCQPAGNKYCEMLDLPAGTFTKSIGSWQSCEGGVYPCSKSCSRNTTSGYSCYGTYNEDGTFSEKVCDSNGYCITTQYNANQKGLRRSYCYIYDSEGNCTKGQEKIYDENGNMLSYYKCTAWAQDGTCSAGINGYAYTYDANGNPKSKAQCTSWEDGTCVTYVTGNYAGYLTTYDENGRLKKEVSCRSWNNEGTCATYGTGGSIYTYDANGNKTSEVACKSWKSDGTCAAYGTGGTSGYAWTYDENGNVTSKSFCKTWKSDGVSCATYSSGYVYTYDEHGNQVGVISCKTWSGNGTCSAYYNSGTVYHYDSNGNRISQRSCSNWDSNGNCTSESGGLVFTYDVNGNKTGQLNCSNWNGDGTCKTISGGSVSIFDENGHAISTRSCSKWNNSTGSCTTFSTTGGFVYTYDEEGKRTGYASCNSWNSAGSCVSVSGSWSCYHNAPLQDTMGTPYYSC